MVRSVGYSARNVASELRMLADSLSRLGVCNDVSPLWSAAEKCHRDSPGHGAWAYRLSDLVFNVVNPRGLLPGGVHDVQLLLSASVASSQSLTDLADPFTSLAIDVVIQGRRESGNSSRAAWHLDRHVLVASEEGSATSPELHPLYHFQYGGRRLHEHVRDFGDTLLLRSPRLLHPPMEAILTVDFVVANFFAEEWGRLRDDGTYRNLVDSAYQRYWNPYFRSIADIWPSLATPGDSTCFKLCPILVHKARV